MTAVVAGAKVITCDDGITRHGTGHSHCVKNSSATWMST